ncbi:MAG: metallophosphoesterase [Christensenellales bacterium]
MKKLFLSLALLCSMSFAALGETLITATDLHYLAPSLTDHGAFFNQLIENSDGKTMAYSDELMDAFVDQVISRKPDALILSGDLTFNGEYESHEALVQKLNRINAVGIPVFVLPGNHDLNNRSAVRFEGDAYEHVSSVTGEEFAALYHAHGYDRALAKDERSLSYVAVLSDRLWLLMIDVNAVTQPGSVPSETLAWIADQLEQAKRSGCRVIAVSHQNLLNHSSLISTGFTIDNAEALLALETEWPVLCHLSGHIHMQHMAKSASGLCDIATSSLAVSPNQYGVLTLSSDKAAYRTEPVDVSSWAAAQGLDDPQLLHFSDYASQFFRTTCIRQALQSIQKDDAPEQLADFFAEINAAYFAGVWMPAQLTRRWRRAGSSRPVFCPDISKAFFWKRRRMPVNGRQECEALDMSQSERRLFYMQGDYGLFQCSEPRCAKTYAAIYRITAALPPAGCLVTSIRRGSLPFTSST